MKLPKVLILGKLPPPYIGPAIATEIILKSKLNDQFELIHLDTAINKDLTTFGKWNPGKVLRNIGIYGKMKWLLLTKRPQLVLIPISQTTTGFFKDSLFILIAWFFRKKIIVQLRGSNFKSWIESTSNLNRAYVKFILKRSKGVIVLGNKLRYLFKGIFDEKKIFVAPNGADYTFPPKQSSEKVKILYLSNLLASKGVVDVVKAAELLMEQGEFNFSLDMIGEWYREEDRMACEGILKNKNLPIHFHSVKSGQEKMQFLANADIFVFPPREPEGHPWAVIEAMAACLPVISTDKGAITESVLDTLNGFIVEPSQPKQIAGKIKTLMHDPALRKNMGETSRKLYLSNFTEEKMVEKLSGVFKNILEL